MASRTDTSASPGPGVLAVDDNPINREFLEAALADRVAWFEAAGDAAGALARAVERRPDIVLMDLYLPGADGIECRARILSALDDTGPAPRFIVLTAEHDDATRNRLLAAGFEAVLHKPVEPSTLLAAIAGDEPAAGRTRTADTTGAEALVDDARALAVAGSRENVFHLRRLLADELATGQADLTGHLRRGERDAARALLHRWRGGCGYAGAERLAGACRRLETALGRKMIGDALLQWTRALALTRPALEDALRSEAVSSPPRPRPGR